MFKNGVYTYSHEARESIFHLVYFFLQFYWNPLTTHPSLRSLRFGVVSEILRMLCTCKMFDQFRWKFSYSMIKKSEKFMLHSVPTMRLLLQTFWKSTYGSSFCSFLVKFFSLHSWVIYCSHFWNSSLLFLYIISGKVFPFFYFLLL